MAGFKPVLRDTAKEWRRILYSRINNLFDYENLPKEIDEKSFKLFLNRNGKVVFYKIGDKFLIQPFTYTDKLNWYYIPKFGRVVNPWLPQGHQNYEFEVEKSAVIYNCTPDVYNFREWGVVADLVHKTAYQLAENDISYYCIQRNHRLIAIFTAENDIEKAECNRILERIYNGEPDVTMGEDLVSHIRVNPIAMNSTRSSITELIEFHQFILANFYHSFGINSNYNLKREQLNSNEIDVNKEVLRLNIEDMLKCRESGVEKVNELYGLDLRVSLNEKVYENLLKDAETMEGEELGEVQENASQETESTTEVGNGTSENNEENSELQRNEENNSGKSSIQDTKTDNEIYEDDGKKNKPEKTPDELSDGEVQVTVTVDVETGNDESPKIETEGGDEDVEKPDPERVES